MPGVIRQRRCPNRKKANGSPYACYATKAEKCALYKQAGKQLAECSAGMAPGTRHVRRPVGDTLTPCTSTREDFEKMTVAQIKNWLVKHKIPLFHVSPTTGLRPVKSDYIEAALGAANQCAVGAGFNIATASERDICYMFNFVGLPLPGKVDSNGNGQNWKVYKWDSVMTWTIPALDAFMKRYGIALTDQLGDELGRRLSSIEKWVNARHPRDSFVKGASSRDLGEMIKLSGGQVPRVGDGTCGRISSQTDPQLLMLHQARVGSTAHATPCQKQFVKVLDRHLDERRRKLSYTIESHKAIPEAQKIVVVNGSQMVQTEAPKPAQLEETQNGNVVVEIKPAAAETKIPTIRTDSSQPETIVNLKTAYNPLAKNNLTSVDITFQADEGSKRLTQQSVQSIQDAFGADNDTKNRFYVSQKCLMATNYAVGTKFEPGTDYVFHMRYVYKQSGADGIMSVTYLGDSITNSVSDRWAKLNMQYQAISDYQKGIPLAKDKLALNLHQWWACGKNKVKFEASYKVGDKTLKFNPDSNAIFGFVAATAPSSSHSVRSVVEAVKSEDMIYEKLSPGQVINMVLDLLKRFLQTKYIPGILSRENVCILYEGSKAITALLRPPMKTDMVYTEQTDLNENRNVTVTIDGKMSEVVDYNSFFFD